MRRTLTNFKRRRRVHTAAIAAVTSIALAAAGGAAMSASAGEGGTNQLAGLWQVTVNRGPTLPPITALETYFKDGNTIDDASVAPPTLRSTGHGRWEHVSGRTYHVTKTFFRNNPATGAYIGTTKLRMEIELSADGDSFVGTSVPEFRDPDGNLQPGSNARRDVIRGKRLGVEPQPELP